MMPRRAITTTLAGLGTLVGVALSPAAFAQSSGTLPATPEYRADMGSVAPTVRDTPTPPRDTDRLGWYVPDFAKVQTGGLRGRYSAGLGYAAFDDILNVGLLYGYSPNEVNDSGVSTLSLEVSARPFEVRAGQFRFQPLEVGLGVLYAIGDQFEFRYPDRYSSGYYRPTAFHFQAFLGAGVDWVPDSSVLERVGLYYQISSIYPFMADYIDNPDQLSIDDALASTIGYRAAF